MSDRSLQYGAVLAMRLGAVCKPGEFTERFQSIFDATADDLAKGKLFVDRITQEKREICQLTK